MGIKLGGRKLPHDLRIIMCEEVRALHSKGVSYRKIQKILREKYGVEVSRSNISYWVRGIHIPEREPYNRPDLSRERDLAWIAGMYVGDGSVKVNKKGRFLSLKVKDRELAKEAARRLAVVMGRSKPYAVGRFSDGRYYVEIQSRELVDHLLERSNILSYLDKRPREFIQAFFDCDGFASGSIRSSGDFLGVVGLVNTDQELLMAVAEKLDNFDIEANLYELHPSGRVVITSKGKTVARKDCFFLMIRMPESIVKFQKIINPSVRRKREKLRDIADILTEFGSGWEAAVEWIRRYEYKRGMGRQRWFRRKRLLDWDEALEEYERFLARKSSN